MDSFRWLSRPKEWEKIDAFLMKFAHHTFFAERRHPEVFSAYWLLPSLRGMWGVPSRHMQFIGRDKELHQIGQALKQTLNSNLGLTLIETVGIGGVGKTQLAIEFCYRHYDASLQPDEQRYGLIVWIDAQSKSSISKSFHDLAVDAGIHGVDSMDQRQIIQEIKSRLYRSRCPWLLIFDNFEPWDNENPMQLLNNYIPNGSVDANNIGHVLITSRVLLPGFDEKNSIRLGCFHAEESMTFLKLTCGVEEVVNNVESSKELANILGHLPLALAIAAAYMKRCDLSCYEYLKVLQKSHRIVFTEKAYLRNYSIGLGASLSLSIAKVGELSKRVLYNISYLAPDDITKDVLQKIIFFDSKLVNIGCIVEKKYNAGDQNYFNGLNSDLKNVISINNATTAIGIAALISIFFASKRSTSTIVSLNISSRSQLLLSLGIGAGSAALAIMSLMRSKNHTQTTENSTSDTFVDDVDDINLVMKTNEVWATLKIFSMLTVRQHNTSSMHRLLQSLLRTSQTKQEQQDSITCCYYSIYSLWSFHPAKTETWKRAGKILSHAKSICMYICSSTSSSHLDFPCSLKIDAGILLCECALYMSMVLSHFHAALSLLDEACSTLEDIPITTEKIKNALARAYLTRGKVARYCGEYGNSDADMKSALSYATAEFDISAIHHEIGVLALKNDDFEHAKDALLKSLAIKVKYKNSKNEANKQQKEQAAGIENESVVLAFSDESATLHQLAVVNLKKNNLKEAERLFRSALSAESEAGDGGRAATLRQLARVLDRQGKLNEALECLQDARKLYDIIYGKGNSLHVNVCGIEYQLGVIYYRLNLFDDSEKHFEIALTIQKKLYVAIDGNHIDIASTFGEIGKMEIRRGNIAKAIQNVLKQKEILKSLLLKQSSSKHDESKLKQRILAVTFLLRCWSIKYSNYVDQKMLPELNKEITILQGSLDGSNKKTIKKCRSNTLNKLKKRAEMIKISPEKLFLDDPAYNEFDSNGFPIKDKNNKLLTKSKIKRLKKLLEQHKKRHLKWVLKNKVV
jgi:tetratricopeptide (TPR) repeat protein